MEKIKKLKRLIIKENIDGYLIPKNDQFFEENVPDYYDRLKYISNFSGSFGLALILQNKNFLFVDGRYTLQAKNQCGKFFKIITLPEKISKKFEKKNSIIGFDPKLFTRQNLHFILGKTNLKFVPIKKNLIDTIWKRKTYRSGKNFYKLPDLAVGQKYNYKINKILKFLKQQKVDFQFVSSCENNAWLFNIRGNDAKYSPIPYCYSLINKNGKIKFFCDLNKISLSFKNWFNNVEFIDINLIEKELDDINNKKIIIDRNTCSLYFENIINKKNKIINLEDQIYILKARKDKTEINNMIKSHIYDGAALTKYLFWIKKNFEKKKITEISGSNKLLEFRRKNKKFKFLIFPTISGTGANGAVIHYKASKKTNKILKKGNIYLIDSGGQYKFGTTDTTRTISLSNSNKKIKKIFTRVLKGHIAVADFNLNKFTSGSELDLAARKYLKQIGLNYAHGTGHGVGYFLNVHEGPHAISKNNKIKFLEGMIVSNEPGYYEKNKFGIRIENLIYVKKSGNKNTFENLTMVPIDKDLIDKTLMDKNEIDWLNKYHERVFNNLKKFMNKKELLDLKKACSAI